jgi:hypothetical protein
MMGFPFHPLLEGIPGKALVLALGAASLVLIFAGRSVIKVVAFLVVGLVGALIGGVIGAMILGSFGALFGITLGFVVGGLAGIAMLALGIGLIIGYAGYVLALDQSGSHFVALVAGFVLFVIGLAFHNKIVSIVTAVAGGMLFFDVLRVLGMAALESMIVAAFLAIAGIYVQDSTGKKMAKPAAPHPPAPTNQPKQAG